MQSGEVKEFTLTATNFEFDVKEIKVKKGDNVKITLVNTEGLHGIMVIGYDKQTTDAGSIEFVADQVGEFDIRCSVMCGTGHGEMVTKLIVEE